MCDNFISCVFKKNVPRVSLTMGDWYATEYFTSFRIWGGKKTCIYYLWVVLHGIALAKVAFQRVTNGVHGQIWGEHGPSFLDQIHSKNTGAWPKFPLHIGHLVIHNAGHGGVIAKEIICLKLGFAKIGCTTPRVNTEFVWRGPFEKLLHNDSSFQGAHIFEEVMCKIIDPYHIVNSFLIFSCKTTSYFWRSTSNNLAIFGNSISNWYYKCIIKKWFNLAQTKHYNPEIDGMIILQRLDRCVI